ncbi:zinc knuckle CX2CX4HX4C containing protein [Tanacetum coccineum]
MESEVTIKDIAKRIKNIDGKLIGKDGKPLVAKPGEPKSDGLGTKFFDANMERPVPHNPKNMPINSILKGNEKASTSVEGIGMSFAAGLDGEKVNEHGVCIRQATDCLVKGTHVQPVSHADVMGKTTSRKVNVSSLVNDAVIPGADIVIPSDAVMKRQAGMEQVLANGPWHIRLIPIMLNIWNPTKKLIREEIKMVPVWVKLHDVPVVAYSKVELSLITTKGRCSYARVLTEMSAERALVESFVMAIPIKGGEGHSLETIMVEYEWKPPRCETCLRFTKPKSTWVIKSSKPSSSKVNNSNNSSADTNIDDINLLELKNSFDKLKEEGAVFDVVKQVDSGKGTQEYPMNVSINVPNAHVTSFGMEVSKEAVSSSSKPKLSFGGNQLEEEFDFYDDDYADQICDLPGQIKAFRDFQLLNSGRN